MREKNPDKIRATTILAVRKNGKAVVAGDGQVSFGPVGAGETVLSEDTVTIRIDRRYSFDPAALHWSVP